MAESTKGQAFSFYIIFVALAILTCVHESWVMTESVLSQVPALDIGFLRRVQGVTLRNKVPSRKIYKA